MALQATVVFEVDDATGSDDNGGGFDDTAGVPGTDYTYGGGQTTIEWAAAGGDHTNDLAATDASPSVLSSAARNFVAADVGNLIHISAGTNFTAGWYQIISVAANEATLDDNACSGGAGSVGAGILGGSLATPGGLGAIMAAHGVSGQKAHLKAATYTLSTATVNAAGGPLSWHAGNMDEQAVGIEGYQTTREDMGTRPEINCGAITPANAAVIYLDGAPNGLLQTAVNIKIDGNDKSTSGLRGAGVYDQFYNCLVIQCANGIYGGYSYKCESHDNNSAGLVYGSAAYCWSHDNSGDGFSSGYFIHCIASNNGDDGYVESVTTNCVAYSNTGCGWKEGYAASRSANSIAVDNGEYGFSFSKSQILVNCASYNNTSGRLPGGSLARDIGKIELSGDPFTNAAGDIYLLDTTAGEGAACAAAGIGVAGQTDTPDVGAISAVAGAGGGSGGVNQGLHAIEAGIYA